MLDQQQEILSKIKVVGFDLDGTLYKITPEIQSRVRNLIYKKISKEFNIPYGRARNLFEEIYSETHSGSQTIKRLEQQFVKTVEIDIIQDSLQEADILDLIPEDSKLVDLLNQLKEKYHLDVLTSGEGNLALEKLKRIGVDKDVFQYILTREDGLKNNGSLFQRWMQRRPDISQRDILYVGDNQKQDIDIPKQLGIKTCFIGEYSKADFQIKDILNLEKLLLNFPHI